MRSFLPLPIECKERITYCHLGAYACQELGPYDMVELKIASYRIASNRRQELPLHGVTEVEPDIVIAALNADLGLHRQTGELAFEGVRGVDAAEDAIVVLVELIAIDGIGEEVGEIVPQIERTLDDVEISLGGTAFVGLRPAPGQRKAVGIAAVAGIEGAIESDFA